MTLRVIVHNVGHGQAVHAFTPAGETIVIDLGCSANMSPLGWLRRHRDTIDLLVVTHPHGDHIDEIDHLEEFRVRQIWRPKWLPKEDIYQANQSSYADKVKTYLELSANMSHPIAADRRVGNPDVSGGVSLKTFATPTCNTNNINNHSGVSVIEYGGVKVVIPGDNEPPSWRELAKNSAFTTAASGAHVFMASHHGRRSGYCTEIFSEIFCDPKPRLCVVSDGRKQNTDARARYSHHASGHGVYYRTLQESDTRSCVTTRTDGFVNIEIGKQDSGRPYLWVDVEN